MATYDKCIFNIPPYQEGNEADFEFDIDTNFPIDIVKDITFQVKTTRGEILMSLRMSGGKISLNDRTIRIPISPADTKGKSGAHAYEIDFINQQDNPFATIGGTFTINKEINTL